MAVKYSFRIDDLGFENEKFFRLTGIFDKYGIKYSAAAIPFYVENIELKNLSNLCEIWAHGFRHSSHGDHAKCEYPGTREKEEVFLELVDSFRICTDAFGENFRNGFIPPWNRFSEKHFGVLKEAGFKTFFSDKKHPACSVPQIAVNIDLHTDKTKKYQSSSEIRETAQTIIQREGVACFMLHHNHMDEVDFLVIEEFLKRIESESVVWPTELL